MIVKQTDGWLVTLNSGDPMFIKFSTTQEDLVALLAEKCDESYEQGLEDAVCDRDHEDDFSGCRCNCEHCMECEE